jgi:thiamine biosynthesis lipoprotein
MLSFAALDEEGEIRRARPLLGTLVEISATGPHAAGAVQAAFRAMEQVHALMSYHDPLSDVSRLNRDAGFRPIEVHPWTWRVLVAAREFSSASDGLFDVTVAPTLARLGYLPRHPGMPRVTGRSDWRAIELLAGHRVRFLNPLRIDLGGIAKGFAVDQAVAVLRSAGTNGGCVNAGGDLRLFGHTRQPIHVRHPGAPARLLPLLEMEEGAAATSAGYFAARRRGGRWVTPHILPHGRQALAPGKSVTVRAETCMAADALTKVVMADLLRAGPILAGFNARAMVMESGHDGEIAVTTLPAGQGEIKAGGTGNA